MAGRIERMTFAYLQRCVHPISGALIDASLYSYYLSSRNCMNIVGKKLFLGQSWELKGW